MSPRSLLFVPADSERKLARATEVAADNLILDLEDAVALERKPAARALAGEFLRSKPTAAARTWVRINALGTSESRLDLEVILPARPYGLLVPKVDHPSELTGLGAMLDAFETDAGIPLGSVRLIPILETPRALLMAADYLRAPMPRLTGVTWGAQDLSNALGLGPLLDDEGEWVFELRSARAQCVLVARALEVDAIETVTREIRDLDALRAVCLSARAAGCTGKLTIHPDQIAVINSVFTPSAAEIEHANQIIAAFAETPNAGAIALNGTMIDLVHLRAARAVLSRAGLPE